MNNALANYALCHLAFLMEAKNEVNRKRRRFYNIIQSRRWMCFRVACNAPDKNCEHAIAKRKLGNGFTIKQAEAGYEAAKMEMKAMNAAIQEAKKVAGATTERNASGGYTAIKVGTAQYYRACEFKWLADAYLAEKKTFGGEAE